MARPRILGLCGSLRARSSNRAVLQAFAQRAPAEWSVEIFERLDALPHFNPDWDDAAKLPAEVGEFQRAVRDADAVIVSTPEYMHALPGVLKNALEWLVGDPAFAGKPVVILHIDRGSTWARDSLREVLRTMAARTLDDASVSLAIGSNLLDEAAILARPELRASLQSSVDALARELRQSPPRGNGV